MGKFRAGENNLFLRVKTCLFAFPLEIKCLFWMLSRSFFLLLQRLCSSDFNGKVFFQLFSWWLHCMHAFECSGDCFKKKRRKRRENLKFYLLRFQHWKFRVLRNAQHNSRNYCSQSRKSQLKSPFPVFGIARLISSSSAVRKSHNGGQSWFSPWIFHPPHTSMFTPKMGILENWPSRS